MAILAIIAMAIVLSMNVGAATVDIEPQQEVTDSMMLHKGETVRWAWTARQYDLSFSIVDLYGDTAYFVANKVTDTGTITATTSGHWKFNWQNEKAQDPSYDYTITLDYTITVLISPPVVRITANVTSGTLPLSVAFEGSGTDPDGSVTSYSWDLGDGGKASTMKVIHTYRTAGTYTVNLTCTDDDGAKGYAPEVIITVLPANPTVTNTTPAQWASGVSLDVNVVVGFSLPMVQADVSAKMSITPAAPFTTYWSNGNMRVTVSFDQELEQATSYALTIGRANASNGGRLAQPFTLRFSTLSVPNVLPMASISVNVTLGVAPLAVGFNGTGTDADGTISSYLWAFGDGATATTRNATHTYSSPGTYTVKLTVTDDLGTSSSAEVEVAVLPVVPVVVSFYPANNAVGVPVIVDVAVNFSLPMARSDLQSKLTIVPAAAMTLIWSDSDRQLSISFTYDLQYITRYSLTIARANATNGGHLAQPFFLFFTTEAGEVPVTVRILSPTTGSTIKEGVTVTLTGESTGIPQGAEITVTFGDAMGRALVGADGNWSLVLIAPRKGGEVTITATYLAATYSIKAFVETGASDGGSSKTVWIALLLAIVISAVLVFLLLSRRGAKPEPVEEAPPAEATEEGVEPEGDTAEGTDDEQIEDVYIPPEEEALEE